ncbi:MAG: cyclic nucleotide-binding domain-containing protein [gamma proteobacterium symbiont of Bathyaustriella thionipta]|nr:cyclic nucleotide-binding domain-containing protein [gamma proteobacterium symbiont of Bathyaustriella thionipta]MCU7949306.1 cyclic nucleotide-binding domain-containing protein [gamma proteobacterium symbiont of Bathyaustriella thionipta]MCU7954458.1 cyclic nucleotide-binding domain-containing protein [gamma proteobacterium symbiont of Bathyaustriella thionipta]MCU7958109.1 cyclic nucleotide-binding domain-containing protein [gamma proteobacterium symbiont of Bathyaustriella thionipta]MCU79
MSLQELIIPNQKNYTFEEKVDLLDASLWGQELKWEEVKYMAKYFDVYNIQPDTEILKEGDRSQPYIGLIMKGTVDVVKKDINGENKKLTRIGKNRTFGEMSVIDDLPSSASIITASQVILMALEKNSFRYLVKDKPSYGNKFLFQLLKLMSARLRQTSGKLIDL